MSGLGTQELIVILIIVLILFGSSKLPEVARSLGRSLSEFKKGIDEGASERDKAEDTERKPSERGSRSASC